MTTLHLRKSTSRSPLRVGFLLISLVLACFALSPAARAVDPPPDGGYPNGNTAEGDDALFSLTTGVSNTAIGFDALHDNTTENFNTAAGFNALFHNTSYGNTATGANALEFNTTGQTNTANGWFALASNTTGGDNTATGVGALANNTVASNNTANGASALGGNTTGSGNTAIGAAALQYNSTGLNNTATGLAALDLNNGDNNTANGFEALLFNTTGNSNTGIGVYALFRNTTGSNNTAIGFAALDSNRTGSNNTATGVNALLQNNGHGNTAYGETALSSNTNGTDNTAVGQGALLVNRIGSHNIAVGSLAGSALTRGEGNIDIGHKGVADESNTIRIGTSGIQSNTYVAGINGVTVAGGVGVIIDTNGHLGTVVSSERYKDSIRPMDKASEAILALRPVTFRYKHQLDPAGIPQFGLVAEQVEKVNPDLVARDEQGKAYTVRYEAVNAMLLNEFLKEHRAFLEEQRKVQELQANAARQQKLIETLAAGLQKVSAQLEVSKPAPQAVVTNE